MDARLSPPHFLAMKATLMREAERLGSPPSRERVRRHRSSSVCGITLWLGNQQIYLPFIVCARRPTAVTPRFACAYISGETVHTRTNPAQHYFSMLRGH